MRVNSTFSGCFVTAVVEPLTPSVNVVREKLVFTRMSLFKYQLRPTDHAFASEAEPAAANVAPVVNAALSMSKSA